MKTKILFIFIAFSFFNLNAQQSDLSANKIMIKVYKNYQENQPEETHMAKTYSAELIRLNNDPVVLNESIGYSIYLGQKRNTAVYSDYKFVPKNSRISTPKAEFEKWIEKETNVSIIGLSTGIHQYRVFQELGPISKKKHNVFKYNIEKITKENEAIVHFVNDHFEGELTVDLNDYSIKNASYTTKKLYSMTLNRYVEGDVELYFENSSRLSKISSKYKYKEMDYENNLMVLEQKLEDFAISSNEYWAFNLYSQNPFVIYNETEWKKYENILSKFDNLDANFYASATAELKNRLTENTGKWLTSESNQLKLAYHKIRSLELQFD